MIISSEMVLVSTICVLGATAGLTTLRDSVSSELADVSGAIESLDQSYAVGGIRGQSSWVSGSHYIDRHDVRNQRLAWEPVGVQVASGLNWD